MARHYKKWAEHSPRWQREAKRDGMSPQRWDGWLKLSDKTRKDTDPKKYAAGKSVAAQRREGKERKAFEIIRKAASRKVRTSVVQRNVERMSDSDLDWTIKASKDQIRKRASMKHVPGYVHNPWWYM